MWRSGAFTFAVGFQLMNIQISRNLRATKDRKNNPHAE
ncbi:hypothetical protein HMPREF9412_1816 [Paenibacillus sp. HGF5]|nr:hypothetical protein HMPREF9412_1816 [Paenibacillus sp. HGF5]